MRLPLVLAALLCATFQEERREPNHLANETSPYLRQHMYNPVDWYPWGEEALAKAREEDKPIFLSIGYAACHWCHVMERESFENEEIAAQLNAGFVCIKVDREERPDLDEIYMSAVQKLNRGQGGWPMSVFLTPELEPFFGGTYFPPHATAGRPGFDEVLQHVRRLWTEGRDQVEGLGRALVEAIRSDHAPGENPTVPSDGVLARAVAAYRESYDPQNGGFGSPPRYAPKFPRCTDLVFLVRYGTRAGDAQALHMAEHTLTEMAQGGVYDHVGGGFHRYSVDRSWTVPHFEKMLYDNALLAVCYLETFQATGNAFYRRIAREILDYVLREMTSPEGGFYSTTDADSEGEEGKFFVWSLDEFREVCGEHADFLQAWFAVTKQGNFEGANILTERKKLATVAARFELEPDQARAVIDEARRKLYERREHRVHPLLDDKVLSAWNGLMLTAFARSAAVLGDGRDAVYIGAARRNADFLLTKMRREDGGLYRTRREGRSHLSATLEDYAYVAQGLLDLYEADPDPRWLRGALELHAFVEEHFADEEGGGYFSFSDEHEPLPVRPRSATEGSLPSDVGVAAMNAMRLGLLAGDTELLARAHTTLASHGAQIERYPPAFGELLLLLDFQRADPTEVYVVGPKDDPAVCARLDSLRKAWPPYRVFTPYVPGDDALVKLLPAAEGKDLVGGKPAAYVCHEGVCEAPEVLEE